VLRPSDFAPVCPDYETAVQPVITTDCGGCHNPANPDAGVYLVTDYRSVLRPSDQDVRRVNPGDASSPFLQAARGELSGHTAVSSGDQTLLTTWVVSCRGGHGVTQFHPAGWADPLNGADFHGAVVRDGGYDFHDCKVCHGSDLRGGTSSVDCNSCHAQADGPLACNTCHGDTASPAPPKALNGSYSRATLGVGAHRKHVTDGPLHKAFSCETCHPHVARAEDDGHYRFNGVFLARGPVVNVPPNDAGTPAFNSSDATCSQSACHAPNVNDTKATNMTPVWTRTTGEDAKCGSCHGLGPEGHPATDRCDGCHGPGYADGGVDLALHLNGRVDVSVTSCDSCHAGPTKGATFYDTHGSTDATSPSVGAHAAHFETELRGPLACDDCHIVPKTAVDPGHLGPGPAPVTFSAFAAQDGVMPSFDSTALTCNVYCHGGGLTLTSKDTTPNLTRNPVWNKGDTQDQCGGACHGAPPQDGQLGHTIATSIGDCAQCHALTVNPDGGIRTFVQSDGGIGSFHINGQINGNL
jgi:predicted CxxxxCH...CXXCH cytochrome family protein